MAEKPTRKEGISFMKRGMLLVFFSLLVCSNVWGGTIITTQPSTKEVNAIYEVDTEESNLEGALLTVVVREKKTSNQNCNLSVRSFEYIEPTNLVVLRLSEEPNCTLDRIGKRKATWYWEVPPSVLTKGKLLIVANDTNVGRISF